jgi:hypothetical protein
MLKWNSLRPILSDVKCLQGLGRADGYFVSTQITRLPDVLATHPNNMKKDLLCFGFR